MNASSIFAFVLAWLLAAANAVDLDLAGNVFKKGGKIRAASTATVPAALLYDVRVEARGTGTGTFADLLGTGDLATRLEHLQPGASQKLRITLANIPQKLPVTLGQTTAFDQLSDVPIGNGAMGSFTSKGKIKAQIIKTGIVKASAKKMSFAATNQDGAKVKVTGEYTVNTGRLVVEPSPATSPTPQGDFILLLNKHFTIGNDEYEARTPGTVDVVSLKRGRTKSDYFVIQNDGPVADSFTLRALFPSPGVSLRVFDGKTEITDQVVPAQGYVIDNLPSGGTRLLRMVVKVEKDALVDATLFAGVRVQRSADGSGSDTGGFSVFVR